MRQTELASQPNSRAASGHGMAWCTTCQTMRILTCSGTMMGVGRLVCRRSGGRSKEGDGESTRTMWGSAEVVPRRRGIGGGGVGTVADGVACSESFGAPAVSALEYMLSGLRVAR